MFKCPLCTKTFSNSANLSLHTFIHTNEKPHKCSVCLAAFGRKDCLKQHVKEVHDGIKQRKQKSSQCPVCSYKCYSKTTLQIHMRKHFAELPFSCDIPGCGFKTKYKCTLSRHAIQAHSDKRPFQCTSEGCSYKAKRMETLRNHLKVHSNDKPFACTAPGCSYTSKDNDGLRRHTSRVHNEKPLKCSACDFEANARSSLRQHELQHNEIKRFQCQAPNCGFASHQRQNLEDHFDRKHRNKDVICTEPACNLRFGSIALLKIHLKRQHKPKMKCPADSCIFRTKIKQHLLAHISCRHKDLQAPATVGGPARSNLGRARVMSTLQCPSFNCSYQTKSPHLYDHHVLTHSKDDKRQHVCSLCSSRFSHLYELNDHIHKHVREKPYSCAHCNYTTGNRFELRGHARRNHHIHVVSRRKEDEVRKCRTCGRTCFSYSESVLHSMSHLRPVVVLKRLFVNVE